MARLTAINGSGSRLKGRPHEEIDNAESFHFEEDDEVVFQLNTFGRTETREIPGKLSQTIQITRPAARQLIKQLQNAFPGILDDERNGR